jgi:hypothetical protein
MLNVTSVFSNGKIYLIIILGYFNELLGEQVYLGLILDILVILGFIIFYLFPFRSGTSSAHTFTSAETGARYFQGA